MPLAMLLRSVPLVAMAPSSASSSAAGWAVRPPSAGCRVLPRARQRGHRVAVGVPQAVDVVRVNGGTKWTALRKVAIPSALPNLFAALRISVPGAVIGAMLYEWLFSGTGMGAEIFRANSQVQYNLVWSIVVVVTFTSILLYTS